MQLFSFLNFIFVNTLQYVTTVHGVGTLQLPFHQL